MKQERVREQRTGLICLLLVIGTVAVYWPVRHFEFLNFDDPSYVTANPNVFRGISWENAAWAFKTIQAGNWHPLTWLSHMLDCQLFGYQAGWHHLVNLFFHTVNTLLIFNFCRQLTGAVWRSALVAALFAYHPLHVESVAWIAERKDVLSTFFGLLTMIAYGRYVDRSRVQSPKARAYYALALSFFALGLMSKPMLVTLPLVLLLLDFWPLGRLQVSALRRLLLEKLPFLLLSVAASLVTLRAQAEAMVAPAALPVGARLVNAVMAYAAYLRKMIWPADLAAYYPYRHSVPTAQLVGAIVVLALISILALRQTRRAPYLLFGWLWYLGMLVPVIGLVQVGGQSMADRYTYLPLVGVFVMCVWGAAELLSGLRLRTAIAGVVSGLLLAGCLGVTWLQVPYWRDSETLFRRDLELFPQANAMGHHCLGRALFLKGDDAGAIPHQEEVLRLLPDFASGHLHLANSLSRRGRFAEAMIHYSEAIRLKPEDPETYKCLGTCLAVQMKLDEAATNFRIALQYKPDYAEAYTRLGTAEMAQGKVDDALKHLAAAVQIHPDYAEGQYYLANALADQRRFDEAVIHLRAAIKANPNHAAAMDDLAWLLATESDPKRVDLTEVITLAQRACGLTQSTNAAYLQTLGVAFSEAGRFAEAIATTEQSITAALAAGDQTVVAEMQRRLVFYRAGRSYTKPPETPQNR